MDIKMTTDSGNAIAEVPFEIEIDLMVCMYAMTRKYTFGAFLN